MQLRIATTAQTTAVGDQIMHHIRINTVTRLYTVTVF